MMKKILIPIITLFFLFPHFAQAQDVNTQVQSDLAQILRLIVKGVNEGNAQSIIDGISPNARPELQEEIRTAIEGKEIEISISTKTITENDDNTYTIKGIFSARGISENSASWNIEGLPNEFTFEKIDGGWWLLETNFHQRLGSGFTLKFIGIIFAIVSVFILFIGTIAYRKHKAAQELLANSSLPDNL